MTEFGTCPYCKNPYTGAYWCQNCDRKSFQQDFDKWTSGNKHIDKFIQEAQLKARRRAEVIEWIPYNRLSDIKYLTRGGFSTIYEAICKDYVVILKSLNNSSNISEDFLNEWKNYLQFIYSCDSSYQFLRIYGITQDPETSNYMVVMDLMEDGNLRSNLLIKKYNPFEKYINLLGIARQLSALHRCNLVHGDFHSGNILLDKYWSYISDFGLSQPADKTINSNEIYGVIPYMAPEVLRGKQYTKAADIYSFGIIMWEFTSGIPAFNNTPHDFELSLDICKGLRPKIVESTLPVYARLMKRCWDSDPKKRPTADELVEILSWWYDYYPKTDYDYNRIPVPDDEPVTKNHPLSCYTSRKIDYSAKINEILEELSSKIVIDEEYNNETTLLSENLDNYIISDFVQESEEIDYLSI